MLLSILVGVSATLIFATAATLNQHCVPHHLRGTSFGIFGRNATFDYIIVGAGIAGSVAASRLSEANLSVALIEAGSFYEVTNGNLSQVPLCADEAASSGNPQVDWGLVTEPQVNGKRYHYAQGKALGGSSAINSMLYHWPIRGATEAWSEVVGDLSFRWEGMVKYLRKSVMFPENPRRKDNGREGEGDVAGDGPLKISMPAYVNPLSEYGPNAFASIALGERSSLTNGSLHGYGWWQFTIDPGTGLRSSAETSFLSPALDRTGLTVYSNAHARKIIFEDKTATGILVTTIDDKGPFIIRATKGVIIAAGVYHSPQLLMVSGIGDRGVLKRVGVPLVHHLSGVGHNMHDSCYITGPVYEVSVPGPSYWREPSRLANATERFLNNATGPLTNIGLDLAVWDLLPEDGRANLSQDTLQALEKLPSDWPLLEYSLSSSSRIAHAADPKKHYGTIDCVLTAPTSKGNMTINSPSNLDSPVINPNWLQTKVDQELAIKAYHRARKVWEAIPNHLKIGREIFPGADVTSDQDILQAIMEHGLGPVHHATGSCRMGKAHEPEAVVDSKGRVHGIERLRVIDSSTFPFTPPGHTQALVYAVAEKLADDILIESGRDLARAEDEEKDHSRPNMHGDL